LLLDFGEVRLVRDADGSRGEPGEAAPPGREAEQSAKHSRRENLKTHFQSFFLPEMVSHIILVKISLFRMKKFKINEPI
jgi:hypothetical protein